MATKFNSVFTKVFCVRDVLILMRMSPLSVKHDMHKSKPPTPNRTSDGGNM